MSEFKNCHPLVNFSYFVAVIGFSMFFLNPWCIGISIVSAVIHLWTLEGALGLKKHLGFSACIAVAAAIINPLFNHGGVTVLAYFPSGNPLTLESVIYGMAAALMLGSVIVHFSCFHKIMTSDKIMYLFGKVIPSLSLMLSMVLRLVPQIVSCTKDIMCAKKSVAGEQMGFVKKIKRSTEIFSAVVTRTFEDSLDMADSMKSRGYGVGKRSACSNYKLNFADKILLCIILILSISVIICGGICKGFYFRFFPSIIGENGNIFFAISIAAYTVLFFIPVFIHIEEEIKWKKLKSKI